MKSIKANQRIRLEINTKVCKREREREVCLIAVNKNKTKNAIVKKNFSSKYLSLLVIIGTKIEHIYI